MSKLKGKARANARKKAFKQKTNFTPRVELNFVDQIMHNIDMLEQPSLAFELTAQKLMNTPNRLKTLRETGEACVDYTIKPNGEVYETSMQKGVDEGAEKQILFLMNDVEEKHFAKRHGILHVKDSATLSKKDINELDSNLQNALAKHGELYIGRLFIGTDGQYVESAFTKETA
tara:strand:+ start:39 stop:560 length:522 start_codon:yes stop_codon:yes gene_type:complete